MGLGRQHWLAANVANSSPLMSPSMLLLVLIVAFAATIEVTSAKALTLANGRQQTASASRVRSIAETQVRSQVSAETAEAGIAAVGNASLSDTTIKGKSASVTTKRPVIVSSEFIKKSLMNDSKRHPSLPKRRVSAERGPVEAKDDTRSGFGVFVDHISGESTPPMVDTTTDHNDDRADNDGGDKVAVDSSQKLRSDLTEAQSEENEVLSLKEVSELKPKEKKLRERQHQLGVHRALEEEEFDFEHYFDKIPSYDYNENSDRDGGVFRGHNFGGRKIENQHQVQEVPPGLTSLGITLTPDVSMMKKILALLGLEDTSFVDHHLREAEKTVNATVAREKLNQNRNKHDPHDDDLVIVKSVRVNVRKVP